MYSYVFVTNPNIAEGLGGDMMRGGPEPRNVVLVLHSTLAGSQMNRGGVYAPLLCFFLIRKPKIASIIVRRRFLTMLLAIGLGREYTRNFDGAPSQGVLRDSLSSFKPPPTLQGGETHKVRVYFEHVRSLTSFYVY